MATRSITASVVDNNIVIHDGRRHTVSISDLQLSSAGGAINKDSFTAEQKQKVIADMKKDAKQITRSGSTRAPSVVSKITQLFTKLYYTDESTKYSDYYKDSMSLSLSHLLSNMESKTKHLTQTQTWTVLDDSEIPYPKFTIENFFFETGLNLVSRFDFLQANRWFNIANKEIDPACRAVSLQNKTDLYWPDEEVELRLETTFLELFGFPPGTTLQATLKRGNVFHYKITVLGRIITNMDEEDEIQANIWKNGTYTLGGENFNCFDGNAVKNNNIHTFFSTHEATPTTVLHTLQVVALVKEMGDVFQVLIMYIWSILNAPTTPTIRTNSYMGTNDTVVGFLCNSLQLGCIRSRVSRASDEESVLDVKDLQSVDKAKVYDLTIYQPNGITEETPFNRLEKTFEYIQKHNNKQIEIVYKILVANSEPDREYLVYCIRNGYEVISPPTYSNSFYKSILDSLQNINNQFKESHRLLMERLRTMIGTGAAAAGADAAINLTLSRALEKLYREKYKLRPVFRVNSAYLLDKRPLVTLIPNYSWVYNQTETVSGLDIEELGEQQKEILHQILQQDIGMIAGYQSLHDILGKHPSIIDTSPTDEARTTRLLARNQLKKLVEEMKKRTNPIYSTVSQEGGAKRPRSIEQPEPINYWFSDEPILYYYEEGQVVDMNARLFTEIWNLVEQHQGSVAVRSFDPYIMFVSVYSNLLFECNINNSVDWDTLAEKTATEIGISLSMPQVIEQSISPELVRNITYSKRGAKSRRTLDMDPKKGGSPESGILEKIQQKLLHNPEYIYSHRFKKQWKQIYPYRDWIRGPNRKLYRNIRRMVRRSQRQEPKHT